MSLYSLLQKAFCIHPEITLDRSRYSVRIILIWIINGLIIWNTPHIINTAGTIAGGACIFLCFGILSYIMFIQAYKRISDYGGWKGVFVVMILVYIYSIGSVIAGTESVAGIVVIYIIWISVPTPKEEIKTENLTQKNEEIQKEQ